MPATLSLSMGAPASFGAFTPGVAKDYTATTTATVISTAGDAALTVSDPGHLMNGTFALPEPLQVSFSKSAWTAPVSNEAVTVNFKQPIKATRRAADRRLHQDADVHVVHDIALMDHAPVDHGEPHRRHRVDG